MKTTEYHLGLTELPDEMFAGTKIDTAADAVDYVEQRSAISVSTDHEWVGTMERYAEALVDELDYFSFDPSIVDYAVYERRGMFVPWGEIVPYGCICGEKDTDRKTHIVDKEPDGAVIFTNECRYDRIGNVCRRCVLHECLHLQELIDDRLTAEYTVSDKTDSLSDIAEHVWEHEMEMAPSGSDSGEMKLVKPIDVDV